MEINEISAVEDIFISGKISSRTLAAYNQKSLCPKSFFDWQARSSLSGRDYVIMRRWIIFRSCGYLYSDEEQCSK